MNTNSTSEQELNPFALVRQQALGKGWESDDSSKLEEWVFCGH